MVMRNCIVEVEPDEGVGADVRMSCVEAATFVLEAPRQQLFTVNEPLFDVPQSVPLCVNTGDISVVFDAFTVKPICAFETEVSKPLG